MTKLHGFAEQVIVDTSEREPVYLLTTGEGRYLRFSRSAFHFLRMVDNGVPMEVIAGHFGRGGDDTVTREQVESAYSTLMERVRELDRSTDASIFGLKYPRSIIPAAVVGRISGALAGAFRWPVALVLVACVLSAVAYVARVLRGADVSSVVIPHLWSGYVLLLLSLIVHEFGHAAACARFGARPADIGIGVYFIYPALYSDVTDAWRLGRWQRVIVDIGGIFFQAVGGAAFVLLFAFTGWEPLLAASVLVAGNCLFSLNPLFKFDGYWVISDALGVTSLRADARAIASVLRDQLLGRRAPGLRWPRGVAAGIIVFGMVAAVTWVLFMARVIPGLWAQLANYPTLVASFVRDLALGGGSVKWSGVLNFVIATFFTVMGSRMAYDLCKRTGRLVLKTPKIGPWLKACGESLR